MDLPKKKFQVESGLNQRDRAKPEASPIKSFVKTTKIFRFVGCVGARHTTNHADRQHTTSDVAHKAAFEAKAHLG